LIEVTPAPQPHDRSPSGQTNRTLVADGHVHIYRTFDVAVALEAAVRNLRRLVQEMEIASNAAEYALLLGDTRMDRAYDRIREGKLPDGWQVEERSGEAALRLRRGDDRLLVIAGRQLVTSERLEVQAIGTSAALPDGLAVDAAIAAVRDAGAFPVVPWGFGKWWGARGNLVRQVIEREDPSRIALGDNGGRLGLAGRPTLLAHAERLGINVIAGSDPLPFPKQARRIGTFGFVLLDWQAEMDATSQIHARLASRSRRPVIAGRTTGPVDFLLAQTQMQIQNRSSRGSSR
jgi:hypothetical protein